MKITGTEPALLNCNCGQAIVLHSPLFSQRTDMVAVEGINKG